MASLLGAAEGQSLSRHLTTYTPLGLGVILDNILEVYFDDFRRL